MRNISENIPQNLRKHPQAESEAGGVAGDAAGSYFKPVANGGSKYFKLISTNFQEHLNSNLSSFDACLDNHRGFPKLIRSASSESVAKCYTKWQHREQSLLQQVAEQIKQPIFSENEKHILGVQVNGKSLGVGIERSDNGFRLGVFAQAFSDFFMGLGSQRSPEKKVDPFFSTSEKNSDINIEAPNALFTSIDHEKNSNRTKSRSLLLANDYFSASFSDFSSNLTDENIEQTFAHRTKVCDKIIAEKNHFLGNSPKDLDEKEEVYSQCIDSSYRLNHQEAQLRKYF